MERQIQADNAFIKWMEAMSKNVVHIADAWYAAVKWADSHPQWISVEEELPKEEDLYIVSNGKSTSVAYWVEDEWDSFGDVITHWMPLPEAPRKEDGYGR